MGEQTLDERRGLTQRLDWLTVKNPNGKGLKARDVDARVVRRGKRGKTSKANRGESGSGPETANRGRLQS